MAAGTPQLLWPDRVDQALLDEVVSRIVRAVDPERIVLLGSQARGTAQAGSDLDLLVVMDSPLPRHRRVVPILKALAGIMIRKDVVVYTPGEIEEWRGVREAFITSILAEGWPLYKTRRDLVAAWLEKARRDLVVARNALLMPEISPGIICFHAQQASEKALKAYPVVLGVVPPETHQLEDPVSLAAECDGERSWPSPLPPPVSPCMMSNPVPRGRPRRTPGRRSGMPKMCTTMFSHVLQRRATRLLRSDLPDDRYLGGARFLTSVEAFKITGNRLPDLLDGPPPVSPSPWPPDIAGTRLRRIPRLDTF
ncbi:MAG: HEPN domain-containing protein [Methanospirillum sp.]